MAQVVGLRYLEKFRCIAEACEDPCCTEWSIPVDEERTLALKARMSGSAEERDEFARALVPDPAAGALGRHSLMVLVDGVRCAMLEADRLCAIQRRYGEPFLPDTCAVFPRSVGRVGERVEVAAAMSCPEAARLALLTDGATDLVPLDASAVARGRVHKAVEPTSIDPYERSFDEVRATVYGLLQEHRFPLESRLFFISFFAQQTRYLVRGGAPFDPRHLDRERALLARPELLEQLHAQVSPVEIDDPFAASVVLQVLGSASGPAAFRALRVAVLGPRPPDPAALWLAHRARKAALSANIAARIDFILQNYCANFVIRDWHLKAPSFLGYVEGLLVRVAAFRMLLMAHPALGSDGAGLDAAAVEVVYAVSRMLEHDESVILRILAALAAQNMQSLPHFVSLLKA